MPGHRETAGIRLATRAELQALLLELAGPLEDRFSPGCARIDVGCHPVRYGPEVAGMEGFARALWGLAPFAAGGASYDGWERFREGLANGTDPSHPEFWGVPFDRGQRFVEFAPIAVSLVLAREALWEPLPEDAKTRVGEYLGHINTRQLPETNWLFFRVLVNTVLEKLGLPADPSRAKSDLDLLETFHQGHGWISDGTNGPCDSYCAFAHHFYGLIYCVLAGDQDPARSERLKAQAAEFAASFIQWFAEDGAAIPYGRSMTYRFAQGAFWSALAFAGVEALPWGVVKGLVLRHLRWWIGRPIRDAGGALTVGYAYPNPFMSEEYNSSSSPYWALKAFLCLALPETHPFWTEPEADLPPLPKISIQEEPRMLIQRGNRHVVALAAGQPMPTPMRHMAEKYAKFAYSAHFGFCVPTGASGLEYAATDGMLMLSEEGEQWRHRGETFAHEFFESAVASTWRPWPDVEVRTWLIAIEGGHVRVHRVRSQRRLRAAETGFAIGRAGRASLKPGQGPVAEGGLARVANPLGETAIVNVFGERAAQVLDLAPGSSLMWPRAQLPMLEGRLRPGESYLACAVFGSQEASKQLLPKLTFEVDDVSFRVLAEGWTVFEEALG